MFALLFLAIMDIHVAYCTDCGWNIDGNSYYAVADCCERRCV